MSSTWKAEGLAMWTDHEGRKWPMGAPLKDGVSYILYTTKRNEIQMDYERKAERPWRVRVFKGIGPRDLVEQSNHDSLRLRAI